MTLKDPLISIVTPSFNQARFLEHAMDSVVTQDYPHIEYIIIDAQSTDGSIAIIKKHEKSLKYWVSEPDSGQSEAINKGWRRSTGDILAWLNADDSYCPGAVNTVADIFIKNPETILVHGAANTYDQSGKDILFTSYPFDMDPYDMIASCGGVTTQPSVFIKRSVLDEVGYLNPDLHYIMDWEYWIRIGLHYGNHRFCKTNSILSNNRDWSGTKTNKGWNEICEENRRVLHDIYERHQDDEKLVGIRSAAYRSSYRKQAELARINGCPAEALHHVFHSLMIEPLGHNPARELAIILYVLLGRRLSERLRSSLKPVRSRLNRLIGY
jgi:glycosyltransferase involved in cell wall biosynthesis